MVAQPGSMPTGAASTLSVVLPCRNEARTIRQVLEDLHAQDFPGDFEVVVADGMSDDGTRETLAACVGAFRFRLILVDNPSRHIPSALNAAVRAASAAVIVRVDGHCRLVPDYLRLIHAALQVEGVEIAGPRIEMVPGADGAMPAVIALLLGTRFGTGGTPSRGLLVEPVKVAHTVMSCYRRSVWERIGGYDETLLSNEDFDFDWRAGRAVQGGVWSLPAPVFRLLARPTLVKLAAQRWRYGWWKAAVAWKSPASLHARQVLPAVALAGLPMTAVVSLTLAAILAGIYVSVAFIAAARAAHASRWNHGRQLLAIVSSPLTYAIIHGVWSAGFLAGLVGNRYRRR